MLLGIDQGTTGSTAILLTLEGRTIASFTSAVPQHFPQPGWVEHDPEEIWKSVGLAVSGVLKKSGRSAKNIHCIGITNQRETVSVFDGAKPLHRFIVWQDRRTTSTCEKLSRIERVVQKKSGLPIDPYFSATKIRWILDRLKLKPRPTLRFRTIDSFLFSKLAGVDVIEATNASRTNLLNLADVKWDDELFDIFNVPKSLAPELLSSEGFRFKTKDVGFLPNGIPICAALGDQQAALFGQMGWSKGSGKITHGTGSFVLLNVGDRPVHSKHSLVSTLALQWRSGKSLYALEGSAFICGAWIQWLRDQLGLIKTSADSEQLAKACKDSEEVFVIPALSGMGAPFWKPRLRGAVLGLSRGSGRPQIARASLEALAFQNKALVEAMLKDAPKLRPSWRVDGGASRNNLLMQMHADVFAAPLLRPRNLEATASGVALLAGFSAGLLSLSEIQATWKLDQSFSAVKSENRKYHAKYQQWLELISKLS